MPSCAIREAAIAASLKRLPTLPGLRERGRRFCVYTQVQTQRFYCAGRRRVHILLPVSQGGGCPQRRAVCVTELRGLEAHDLYQTSCRLRCHSAYLRLCHRGICFPVAFCSPRFANCAMATGSLRRQTRGSANFASRRAIADTGYGFRLRVRLGMRCPFAVRGRQLYPRFVPNSPLCQCLRHRLV